MLFCFIAAENWSPENNSTTEFEIILQDETGLKSRSNDGEESKNQVIKLLSRSNSFYIYSLGLALRALPSETDHGLDLFILGESLGQEEPKDTSIMAIGPADR